MTSTEKSLYGTEKYKDIIHSKEPTVSTPSLVLSNLKITQHTYRETITTFDHKMYLATKATPIDIESTILSEKTTLLPNRLNSKPQTYTVKSSNIGNINKASTLETDLKIWKTDKKISINDISTKKFVRLLPQSTLKSSKYGQFITNYVMLTERKEKSFLNTILPLLQTTTSTLDVSLQKEVNRNVSELQLISLKSETSTSKLKKLNSQSGIITSDWNTLQNQHGTAMYTSDDLIQQNVTPTSNSKALTQSHESFVSKKNKLSTEYEMTSPKINTLRQEKKSSTSKKFNYLQDKITDLKLSSTISTILKNKTISIRKTHRNIQNSTISPISKSLKFSASENYYKTTVRSKIQNSTTIPDLFVSNSQKGITFQRFDDVEDEKLKFDKKKDQINVYQNPLGSSFEQSIVLASSINKHQKIIKNNNTKHSYFALTKMTYTLNKKSLFKEIKSSKLPRRKEFELSSTILYDRNSIFQEVSLLQKLTSSKKLLKKIIRMTHPYISTMKSHKKSTKTKLHKMEYNERKITTLGSTTATKDFKVSRSIVKWLIRDPSKDAFPFNIVCDFYMDEGVGSETISSWYYNIITRRCEWFLYLGNNGNGNRFNYRANCENYCIQNHEDFCSRLDIVYCEEHWLTCKMEFDQYCNEETKANGQVPEVFCPPQQPICISNNGAFKKSPIYLTNRQMIPQECTQKRDPGLCLRNSNSVLVYYYDMKYNDCFGFIYSKCGGNSNRFSNKQECMNHCAI